MTENIPFFSIVLPTKNRSVLVEGAIKSVLMQTFADFELVLVDNDDAEATSRVYKQFNDERIRYFRTGNLSVADNWEFGVTKGVGKYLIFLEDKEVLKINSLAKIYNIIKVENPKMITWLLDIFDDKSGIFNPNGLATGEKSYASSNEVFKSVMDGNFAYFNTYAPKGNNTCVSYDLVREIQKGFFGRLCLPAFPDCTMAFQLLEKADTVLHIAECLVTVRLGDADYYSIGASWFLKRKRMSQFLMKDSEWKESEYWEYVPIKTLSIRNTMINIYLRMASILKGRMSEYELNLPNYFLVIFAENIARERNKVDMTHEMNLWKDALSRQNKSVQKAVKKKLYLYQMRRLKFRIMLLLESFSIFRYSRGLVVKLLCNNKTKEYANVIECIQNES